MTTQTQVEAKSTSTPISAMQPAHFGLLPQQEQEEPDRSSLCSEDRLRSPEPLNSLPVHSSSVSHSFGAMVIGPTTSPMLQRKLAIGQPNDQYEQEADRVADQVMQMPEPKVQRLCPECEEELLQRQPIAEDEKKKEDETLQTKTASSEPPTVSSGLRNQITAIQGGGQPLSESERHFFEPRFGTDFSQVRIHTDGQAAEAARAVNARAFTLGRDVVFGEGQYTPGTRKGEWILAHELVHTVQQTNGVRMLQRISFDSCTKVQETTIQTAHSRAIEMLDNAITKLGTYNGTTPADVQTALDTHFHASSSAFAGWIQFNLRYLRLFVNLPQYECQSNQSRPNPAWSQWCIPFMDILLYPSWFAKSIDEQARILIHEWVHKYGCNFDLGYRNKPGYSSHGTGRSLLNADPWAWLVYDIR